MKTKKIQYVYLAISILAAVALWLAVSLPGTKTGKVFAAPPQVWRAFWDRLQNGRIWMDWWASISRVLTGFGLAFAASLPTAFLLGWYAPIRGVLEPWIRFIRCIPPLAFIPLVVVGVGVGESAKVIVIFVAAFLVLVTTIYGGVMNVDNTLIRAAKVLGSNDRTIFFQVVLPASTPYIFVAARLGLASSLTVLIAAELTGAQKGLGQMIQEASAYFKMDVVLTGIILIGITGVVFELVVNLLERRFTAWQETRTM